MDNKLFESSEFYNKRFKSYTQYIMYIVICLLLLMLISSFIVKKEIVIKGAGSIEPSKSPLIIQSTSSEPVKYNRLKETSYVHKGEVLLKYDTKSINNVQATTKKQYNKNLAEIDELNILLNSVMTNSQLFDHTDSFGYKEELENYFDQKKIYQNELNLLNSQNNFDKSQINSLIELQQEVIENYQSQLQQTSTNFNESETKNQLFNAQKELIQLQHFNSSTFKKREIELKISEFQNTELNKLKQQLQSINDTSLKLENEIKEINRKKADLIIRAPRDGIIHLNENLENQSIIVKGTPLCKIYPVLKGSHQIRISSYISAQDISSVKAGEVVRLKISKNLPSPIILQGKIDNISVVPEIINGKNMYKVTAVSNVSSKTSRQLRYGMIGNVSIINGKISYFKYYKNKLLGKDNLNE